MIINTAKHCTVSMFMECRYENNLSVLGDGTPDELNAAWNVIQTEYITIVGINTALTNLEINITNITSRINAVKGWLFVQRDCLQRFGSPLPQLFHEFEKYGHKINYTGDDADLLKQLDVIEKKERQYNMQLTKLKQQKSNMLIAEEQESEEQDSRLHFIKLINILSEARGIDIDTDKMMLDRFAVLYAEKLRMSKQSKSN